MKTFRHFLIFSALFAAASPLAFADRADDDAARKAIRDQQKLIEGRDAMRLQREKEKEVDYMDVTRQTMERRRQKKEWERRLRENFEEVVLQETAKARRFYDNEKIYILEDEAKKRYEKDRSHRFNLFALARIYEFNCDYQLYHYNTTSHIYEKNRFRKERAEEGLKGLILVDKLLADSPKDADLWRMKGVFLSTQIDKKFSQKRYHAEAEAALKKAAALAEDPAEAKLALAVFYFNQPPKYGRNVPEAVRLANEVLATDSRSVDALLILGRAEHEKYNYNGAFRKYKEALAIEPKNPEVNHYYAVARQDRKRFKKLMES